MSSHMNKGSKTDGCRCAHEQWHHTGDKCCDRCKKPQDGNLSQTGKSRTGYESEENESEE